MTADQIREHVAKQIIDDFIQRHFDSDLGKILLKIIKTRRVTSVYRKISIDKIAVSFDNGKTLEIEPSAIPRLAVTPDQVIEGMINDDAIKCLS